MMNADPSQALECVAAVAVSEIAGLLKIRHHESALAGPAVFHAKVIIISLGIR